MDLIGARLGDHLDLQRLPAVLGAEAVGLHAELGHGIEIGEHDSALGAGIVRGHAVDRELCGVVVLPQSLHLVVESVAAHAEVEHAGRERDHADRIAPVQREIANLLLLDSSLDGGALGLQQLGAGLHGDLLLHVAYAQNGRDALLLAGDQLGLGQPPGGEVRHGNNDGVEPARQCQRLEEAAVIGGQILRQPGFDIGDRHRGFRNNSAGPTEGFLHSLSHFGAGKAADVGPPVLAASLDS